MPSLRDRRKLLPLSLLLIVVVGGLLLRHPNHQHPGMPRPGNRGPQTPVVSEQAVVAVDIRNYDFFPRELTVPAGATLTWTNRYLAPHDATDEAGGWTTGMLRQGESGTLVFDNLGAYRYLCTIHPNMRGKLRVEAAASSARGRATKAPRGFGDGSPSASSRLPPAEAPCRGGLQQHVRGYDSGEPSPGLPRVRACRIVLRPPPTPGLLSPGQTARA